jgi:O-antigen ligase
MRPRQITALLTFGAAIAIALCAGISIATEHYALLIMTSTVIVVGILVIMPGYVPLFAFGLLMPFSLPVPFVYAFPFLFLALGICGVKYWLQRGLQNRKIKVKVARANSMDFAIRLFFAWVFVRYCMKPAFPNLMGWGANVTGFRAWLNYALSFGVLFFTGRFVANRSDVVKLMKWLAYISILFIFVFSPVALSRSMALGNLFFQLGMFVSAFDNGILRFVALPEFGVILLSLLLLPNLLKLNRFPWCLCFALTIVAVLLGGSRSGLGMAFIVMTAIPLLRGKAVQFAIIAGSTLAVSAAGYFAGPMLSQLPQTGFLRPLALVSPALTEATGGDRNIEWREIRWQRALEEIRKHPIVGVGYGGLENALISDIQSAEEGQDMDLATGGVHNGFIAVALALGIPAAILFLFILVRQMILNGFRAFSLRSRDPVLADAHAFVCANLLASVGGMFIGSDVNDPMIWFYFALGLVISQLRRAEGKKVVSAPSIDLPGLAGQPA